MVGSQCWWAYDLQRDGAGNYGPVCWRGFIAQVKALHVIPSISPQRGGPSKAIISIASALVARGCDVTVATTTNDGPGRRYRPSDMPVVPGVTRVVFAQTTESYTFALDAPLWFWRNLVRFDVVHVHALFSFMPVCAAIIARLRRVPYIVRPLGTLSAYGLLKRRPLLKRVSLALVERPLLRHAAAVHCTSDAEVDEVRSLEPGAHVVKIPLAVPEEEVAADSDDDAGTKGEALRATFGEWAGMPLVLFLSRLDRKKNLECLLMAWPLVLRALPGARLAIAGAGEASYEATLRNLSERTGVSSSVYWLGHVEGACKRALLTRAWVFVLPSFNENFGIAAVEALAAGVPCVLSDGVAVAPDVASAGAGVIADTEPDAMASAILSLLADEVLREQMAAAARRLACERYSPATLGTELLALYESFLPRK